MISARVALTPSLWKYITASSGAKAASGPAFFKFGLELDSHRRFDIKTADPVLVARLRAAFPGRELVFKIGRFSPDKRWNMAMDALAQQKGLGHDIAAVIRGGVEPHGLEVLAHARARGLTVIPKLNFAKGVDLHNAWMSPYDEIPDTPPYFARAMQMVDELTKDLGIELVHIGLVADAEQRGESQCDISDGSPTRVSVRSYELRYSREQEF